MNEQRKEEKLGLALVRPELRIIHQLLAYNFSGRYSASHRVSKTEVFILESMMIGRRLNLGYWIISQIWRYKEANYLLFGPLITRLSMKSSFIDIKKLRTTYPNQPLSLELLDAMGFFNVYNDYVFCDPGCTPKEDRVLSPRHKNT